MQSLKSEYLLDPNIVFLNHGSFGACPKIVFETYQNWQRELERNPVAFIGRRLPSLLQAARVRLADYLGADRNDIVYFTNPTTAFNMAARSLDLKPGDEILSTEYEYPAMEQTWNFITAKTGARIVHQPTPLPLNSEQEFVDAFWSGVTSRTRVIFLSHIAPFLSLILPVQEICRRARAMGIISIIDGAHAPGQIPLNLPEIDADVYVGACHKWLSAPKGSGFLYARKDVQTWLQPLVVSGGWLIEKPPSSPSAPDGRSWMVYYNEGQGTRDPSAFLSVPSAIEFQETHHWDIQRQRCHAIVVETRRMINELTGLSPLSPDTDRFFCQMASVYLPDMDLARLSRILSDEYHIEVPIIPVKDRHCLRFSIQAYNDEADADQLVQAIAKFLE